MNQKISKDMLVKYSNILSFINHELSRNERLLCIIVLYKVCTLTHNTVD